MNGLTYFEFMLHAGPIVPYLGGGSTYDLADSPTTTYFVYAFNHLNTASSAYSDLKTYFEGGTGAYTNVTDYGTGTTPSDNYNYTGVPGLMAVSLSTFNNASTLSIYRATSPYVEISNLHYDAVNTKDNSSKTLFTGTAVHLPPLVALATIPVVSKLHPDAGTRASDQGSGAVVANNYERYYAQENAKSLVTDDNAELLVDHGQWNVYLVSCYVYDVATSAEITVPSNVIDLLESDEPAGWAALADVIQNSGATGDVRVLIEWAVGLVHDALGLVATADADALNSANASYTAVVDTNDVAASMSPAMFVVLEDVTFPVTPAAATVYITGNPYTQHYSTTLSYPDVPAGVDTGSGASLHLLTSLVCLGCYPTSSGEDILAYYRYAKYGSFVPLGVMFSEFFMAPPQPPYSSVSNTAPRTPIQAMKDLVLGPNRAVDSSVIADTGVVPLESLYPYAQDISKRAAGVGAEFNGSMPVTYMASPLEQMAAVNHVAAGRFSVYGMAAPQALNTVASLATASTLSTVTYNINLENSVVLLPWMTPPTLGNVATSSPHITDIALPTTA